MRFVDVGGNVVPCVVGTTVFSSQVVVNVPLQV